MKFLMDYDNIPGKGPLMLFKDNGDGTTSLATVEDVNAHTAQELSRKTKELEDDVKWWAEVHEPEAIRLAVEAKTKEIQEEITRLTATCQSFSEREIAFGHDIDVLIHENSSLREKMKGMVKVIDLCAAWIKKAHHHDGCVRRYQPYPQRKKRDICDCRRVYILGEIEALATHAKETK